MSSSARTAYRLLQSGSLSQATEGYARLLDRVLHGDAEVLSSIGSLLRYRVGLRCAPEFAYACYLGAARNGNVGAQYNQACAVLEGRGVRKNVASGLRLLRKAMRNGSSEAIDYLGYCYRTGLGVRKDPVRGFKLRLEAATAGVASAQYSVGICLLKGDGVSANRSEGRRWIARAAQGGDRAAREWLESGRSKRKVKKT